MINNIFQLTGGGLAISERQQPMEQALLSAACTSSLLVAAQSLRPCLVPWRRTEACTSDNRTLPARSDNLGIIKQCSHHSLTSPHRFVRTEWLRNDPVRRGCDQCERSSRNPYTLFDVTKVVITCRRICTWAACDLLTTVFSSVAATANWVASQPCRWVSPDEMRSAEIGSESDQVSWDGVGLIHVWIQYTESKRQRERERERTLFYNDVLTTAGIHDAS